MEIRTLKYFLEIAQTGNMTRAATNLHVSQSALSRQMSDLEEELHTSLFTRTNKNTLLTEDGAHLKSRAEEILSLVKRTENEFSGTDEEPHGDVFIGAGETTAMKLIADAITNINKKYPNIIFHLHTGTADEITARLNNGLLDFGILINPNDTSDFSRMDLTVSDIGGVYVKQGDPLSSKQSVSITDLQNVPILCSTRQRELFELAWHNLHLPPESLRCVATFNLFYNAGLLVKAGLGVAVCIGGLMENDENTSLCFIPFEPEIRTQIAFVWKRYRDLSKPCEIFLQEIETILQM